MAANPQPKPHATFEKWIWILIFGGLFAVVIGIAVGRAEESLGWLMAVPGAVLVVTGVVLIYVRSRLPDEKKSP